MGNEALVMQLIERIYSAQALLLMVARVLEGGNSENPPCSWPSLKEIRRAYIRMVYESVGRSVNKTAQILEISRQTVGASLRDKD